ncbi:MAG: IS1380 family transposase [Deltaproteobacteria bacterium]|nr:IS1380 family transposase [Deltaproteobacteria bacterium]
MPQHFEHTSGGLLLREVENRLGIIREFSDCFLDYRDASRTEHSLYELLCQRIFALALGYEDLNDHDVLRSDPLLAVMAGKADPAGGDRIREGDRGKALAGKSTLNRLELGPGDESSLSRYKKIVFQAECVLNFFVDVFLQAHDQPPGEIVLDLDATDDPLHGEQEGRFFHGYYDCYCYLPLYIFCGEHLLCARLRPSNIDGADGCLEDVAGIVDRIRSVWPEVRIVVRGDSGFCRNDLMTWCESRGVKYVLGLAKNARLERILAARLKYAGFIHRMFGVSTRYFQDFDYRTLKSWDCERRVVGKAEYLDKGANPRFVVTNLSREEWEARALYEELYCARGEMENRIKEQQLCLFADRTSTHTMRGNQMRLIFSSVAYLLVSGFRRLGLSGTVLAKAQCDTIRLKLFKIGAQVRVTVRKIWVKLASGYPYADVFAQAWGRLKKIPEKEVSPSPC